jgi:A/G-specific adenine glycosylase
VTKNRKREVEQSSMPNKRRRSKLPRTYPSPNEIDWFRRRLLNWFAANRRDFPWRNSSTSNYVRILSEVLLQRTKAEVVANYLPTFIKRYPSWQALATATKKDLRNFFKPIGLWKRRATSVERLAKQMARRRGKFPNTREEIEDLPNVGQYISNAILLFCHHERQPLLDTNMARVLERFFGPRLLADIRYDPYLQSLAKGVLASEDPVAMNWAILDHAALVCKLSRPQCTACPLAARCKFAKEVIRQSN